MGANRVVVSNESLQLPLKRHPAWRPLVICPKNKPFFAETLKAGKAVAEPPKWLSTKSMLFFLSFALPLAFMFAEHLVNFVGQFAGMQIELVFVGNEYKRPAKFA